LKKGRITSSFPSGPTCGKNDNETRRMWRATYQNEGEDNERPGSGYNTKQVQRLKRLYLLEVENLCGFSDNNT